jgi:hypothetical protein
MAKLTLGGDVFNYPGQGSEPGWGDDSEAWATKVNEILNSNTGNGFKYETQVVLANPGAVVTPIAGLSFNSQDTQMQDILLNICRTDGTSVEVAAVTLRMLAPIAGYNASPLLSTISSEVLYSSGPTLASVSFTSDDDMQIYLDISSVNGMTEVYIKYKSLVNIGSRI